MRGIWSGLGGIITVMAMILSFIFIGDGMPTEEPSELASYLDDFEGLWVHALIVVAAAGLVWFATALHRVTGSLVAVGSLCGAAALLLICDVILLAPTEAAQLDAFTPDVSSLEVWDTAAYFALTNAHVLVGFAAIAFGAEVLRQSLPAWLGWFSVVTGVIGLASAAFFPMLVLWLWLVVTGAVLMARPVEVVERGTRRAQERMTA
ncbi:MAG: hypothetical protein JWM90_2513 [Thermoleophilia bacterium]|nr:hypothetical protein [Thermoleophilia bacterium]